jgi:hypothetical protein
VNKTTEHVSVWGWFPLNEEALEFDPTYRLCSGSRRGGGGGCGWHQERTLRSKLTPLLLLQERQWLESAPIWNIMTEVPAGHRYCQANDGIVLFYSNSSRCASLPPLWGSIPSGPGHPHYIYSFVYLFLTAVGLTPGGSSTVHIYTQTVHR